MLPLTILFGGGRRRRCDQSPKFSEFVDLPKSTCLGSWIYSKKAISCSSLLGDRLAIDCLSDSPLVHRMVFGWGSSSSSSTSSSSAKSDDPPPAPNREQRQACWDARDAYFGCLRKAGVSIPGKEGDACKRENVEYEKNCASAWVSYI